MDPGGRLGHLSAQVMAVVAAYLVIGDTVALHSKDKPQEATKRSSTHQYSGHGESLRTLSHQFRISHNLISTIIPAVCQAIYQVLQPTYIRLPATTEEWRKVATDFHKRWNFPMCIGAIDGRRILISRMSNLDSKNCDDKSHCSMILMAIVDADSKFLYVDVSAIGSGKDGNVWDRCALKQTIESNVLSIPPSETIPLSDTHVPYVFIGGDALPLNTYLMTAYSGKDESPEETTYNRRLNRGRRASENAFGILAARFQILRNPVNTSPENVKDIVLATIALHNMLRETSTHTYTPPGFKDTEDTERGRLLAGEMHQCMQGGMISLQVVDGHRTLEAEDVRDKFKHYFSNAGRVDLQ